jgi:hypothetical protein
MYQKIIVILLFQFWFHLVSNGQDSIPKKSKHLLGVYTGYSHHIIRDDVASPLIYKGSQAPFAFTYKYMGSKSRQSANFYIDHLELSSSVTDKSGYWQHYADNWNATLDYSYLRKAFTIAKVNTNCFLGIKLLGLLNYRNFHYYKDYSVVFAEQLNSIGINFMMEKKLGIKQDDCLRFNVNVPLAAYVILKDRYNGVVSETFNKIDFKDKPILNIITHGDIVTLNKLIEYQTELSYTRFLSKSFGFEFQHRLHFYNFSHYKDLLHAQYLNNQYLMGLIIKF